MSSLFERDGEILIGGLAYDPVRRTLRAAREMVEIIVRDLVRPAFGNVLTGRLPAMRIYPVPNRPDRAWVVMILLEGDSSSRGLFARWEEWVREKRMSTPLTLAAGWVGPEGGRLAGVFRMPARMNRPDGIFRFHPALVAPDGSLLIPHLRILPDGEPEHSTVVNRTLQGVWPHERKFLQVFGFQVRDRSRPLRPAYPEKFRTAGASQPFRIDGFLLWADPEAGQALWVLFEDRQARYRPTGSLNMVDLRSERSIMGESDICLDLTSVLPDGRWVAVRESSPPSGKADLLIGFRDRFVVREGVGCPQALLGVFPLSGRRWAVAAYSWFMLLNGLEVEDFVEVPTHPALLVRDALVACSEADAIVLPEDRIPVSEIRDRVLEGIPEEAVSGTVLGAVRLAAPNRLFLIPSGREIELVKPAYEPDRTFRRMLAASDAGYLVAEATQERWSLRGHLDLLFYDREGNPADQDRIELGHLEDIIGVFPASGSLFLVITARQFSVKYDPYITMIFRLYSTGGHLLSKKRFDRYGDKASLLWVEDFPGGTHVVCRIEEKTDGRKTTFCTTVLEPGTITITIVH